jgi:Rod binding domain-containing protein
MAQASLPSVVSNDAAAKISQGLAARPSAHSSALADPAKLRKAAQDFEAMAIGQFLEPMFDTIDTAHSMFGGGEAEAAWKPMMIQEIGKQIEAHGGLGLADPIYAAMLRIQEGQTADAASPKDAMPTGTAPTGTEPHGTVPGAFIPEQQREGKQES